VFVVERNEAGALFYVFKAGGGEMGIISAQNGFFILYAPLTRGLGFVSVQQFQTILHDRC
jgi:hypothetical protein